MKFVTLFARRWPFSLSVATSFGRVGATRGASTLTIRDALNQCVNGESIRRVVLIPGDGIGPEISSSIVATWAEWWNKQKEKMKKVFDQRDHWRRREDGEVDEWLEAAEGVQDDWTPSDESDSSSDEGSDEEGNGHNSDGDSSDEEPDGRIVDWCVEQAQLAFSKPFYGAPFTSKDNLKTKGFVTIAGNRYLKEGGKVATEDAPVKRMKDADAILVAISTLPNLAMSYACDDTAHEGVTNNPHDTRRIPGGSSSGEGALIGAGASLCGIGNDMGGSVRVPANMNGVFGLRPTSFPDHVVPAEGIVPESLLYKPALNLLTNGPLCRYASDLSLALAVMAGKKVNSFQLDVDFAKDFKLYYLEDLNVLITHELKAEQRFAVRRVKSYFESNFDEPKTTYQDIQAGVANDTFFALQFEALKRFAVPKSEYEQKWVLLKKEKLRKQVAQLLGKIGLLLTPAWPTDVPFEF
ncbi:hypothetical protein niasHT_009375 [Heterodera trifolii]|uniref:Amidase domain-containing protein n=1 Tax=Heterodera trifolii TaxID=157864 RepID=A0ABD2M4R9_9BILA